MNTHPPLVLAIGIIAAVISIPMGCRNLDKQQRLEAAAALAEEAAFAGASVDLYQHPGHWIHYNACYMALGRLISAQDYSPAKLKQALAQLPIKELKGYAGSLVVSEGVFVFDLMVAVFYDPASVPAVERIAKAIHAGLGRALGVNPPATTRAMRPPVLRVQTPEHAERVKI
jgi:hypothetical protein